MPSNCGSIIIFRLKFYLFINFINHCVAVNFYVANMTVTALRRIWAPPVIEDSSGIERFSLSFPLLVHTLESESA